MAAKVGTALFNSVNILATKVRFRNPTVHFHGAHSGHKHHTVRRKARFAAFDVHEFLSPKVRAKARFCHNIVGQFERGLRCNHRVTPMGDVGKRATVNKRRVVLKRLHKVWLHRVFQQNSHRAFRLDIARINRRAVAAIGNNHTAQTLFKVFEVFGEAQDRHNFGGDSDVKAIFACKAV